MSGATLRSSYSGAFDPEFEIGDFSRQALATLGREVLLIGHLQDRVGLPLAAKRFGADAWVELSIDEWMSASPLYSKRMQRALRFEGSDVGTVFKNLQLDIGAPHQFMDFQFRLDGPESGEFWLPHCGALMDVEPFGEKQVVRMCHHIEDPTFDATAAAASPRMRMRPIHRPPRVPADRTPHCRWKVFLDDEGAAQPPHPHRDRVARARIAAVPVRAPRAERESGGRPDYSGPFDPRFQLEDLSHRALCIVHQELAVQIHLLARAFLLAIGARHGDEAAAEIGRGQWTGIAALAAERLRRAAGIEGDGIEAIAKVFQLHPHFQPRTYVDLQVELHGAAARVSIRDCPALAEGDRYSWLAGLGRAPHPALDAIAGIVNPRARCLPVEAPDAALAWDVEIDPGAAPREEPPELRLARLSRGAAWRFRTP